MDIKLKNQLTLFHGKYFSNISDELYHYTSDYASNSITNSKSYSPVFLATLFSSFIDKQEGMLILDILNELATEKEFSSKQELIFDIIKEITTNKKTKYSIIDENGEIIEDAENYIYQYVISFTNNKNPEYMKSHYDRTVIRFNSKKLINEFKNRFHDYYIGIFPVIYNRSDQINLVKCFMKSIDYLPDEQYKTLMFSFINTYRTAFKLPSLKEEFETRIVLYIKQQQGDLFSAESTKNIQYTFADPTAIIEIYNVD